MTMASPLMLDINELFDFNAASCSEPAWNAECIYDGLTLAPLMSLQDLFPEFPAEFGAFQELYSDPSPASSSASSSSTSNPSSPSWPHEHLVPTHFQYSGDGSALFQSVDWDGVQAREEGYLTSSVCNTKYLSSPVQPLPVPSRTPELPPSFQEARICDPRAPAPSANRPRRAASAQKRVLKYEDSGSEDEYDAPLPPKKRRVVTKVVSEDEFEGESSDGKDELEGESPCEDGSTTGESVERWLCKAPGCVDTFTREADLKRHVTTVHGSLSRTQILSETREGFRLWCSRCPKILARVDSRRRHENRLSCGKRSAKMQARKGRPFELED